MTMTRKQFLKQALGVSAAALGITVLAGCGSSSPTPDAAATGSDSGAGSDGGGSNAGDCLANGTDVTIGANHGHTMMVSKADVMAAADKTYHIMGTATHDHTVALTAAQFGQLAQNQAIMTTSSTDANHSHPIMVACV